MQNHKASISQFEAAPGDIVFSKRAFPHDDLIVIRWPEGGPYGDPANWKPGQKFSMNRLRKYLELLELVVICERIVVGSAPSFAMPLSPEERETEAFKEEYESRTKLVSLVGTLKIGRNLRKELVDRGIMIDKVAFNCVEIPSPYQLTEQYLRLNAELAATLSEDIVNLKKGHTTLDDDLARRMATTFLSIRFGNPMYISEYCRANCVPYFLHQDEVNIVSSQEKLEIGLRSGVIGVLKQALDKWSATKIRELETLGISTGLPVTPVATTILKESRTAEDLNRIALQLRDDFSKFRHSMCALQEELASEDTTTVKKLQIKKEIEVLAQQLWGDEAEGLRPTFLQLSNLADLALSVPHPLNLGSIPRISEWLLRLPIEKVIAALRRRKIRMLLKSKVDFLQSAAWNRKIADIFDLSVDEVRESYIEDNIRQPGRPRKDAEMISKLRIH